MSEKAGSRAERTLWVRSFSAAVRAGSAQTGGQHTVVEHELPPGRIAMPLHRHERETETTYVLEGVLSVQLGKRVFRAGAGSCIVKPAGIFHTYWNEGERPARFLDVISPGGLEAFYEEIAAAIPPSGVVDIARVLEISRGYGIEFDMDSLMDIMERHHVQLS